MNGRVNGVGGVLRNANNLATYVISGPLFLCPTVTLTEDFAFSYDRGLEFQVHGVLPFDTPRVSTGSGLHGKPGLTVTRSRHAHSTATGQSVSRTEARASALDQQRAGAASGRHRCRNCGKTYAHSHSMLRHRRLCEGTPHLMCQVCGRQFHRRDRYSEHLRLAHNLFDIKRHRTLQ